MIANGIDLVRRAPGAVHVQLRGVRLQWPLFQDILRVGALACISPLTNVAKIKKPLFVVQGGNDPRVPASEAAQAAFV